MSFSWFKAKAPIQSEDDFLWFLMYRTTGVSCLLRTKAYPRSNLAKLISGIGPLTIPVTQIIFFKGTAKSKRICFSVVRGRFLAFIEVSTQFDFTQFDEIFWCSTSSRLKSLGPKLFGQNPRPSWTVALWSAEYHLQCSPFTIISITILVIYSYL